MHMCILYCKFLFDDAYNLFPNTKETFFITNQINILRKMFPGNTACRLAQQIAVQAMKKEEHVDVLFRKANTSVILILTP